MQRRPRFSLSLLALPLVATVVGVNSACPQDNSGVVLLSPPRIDAGGDAGDDPNDNPDDNTDSGVGVDAGIDAGIDVNPDAGTDAGTNVGTDAGVDAGGPIDEPINDGQSGFIGSPCSTDADCPYAGGFCLTASDGFPRGACSQSCTRFCPDQAGFPPTFCPDPDTVDGVDDVTTDTNSVCLAQCDFEAFVGTGCRTGYTCGERPRINEADVSRFVCLPDAQQAQNDLSPCLRDLAARGVAFTPTSRADDHPDGHPELTCHIEEPVFLHPPIHGIDIDYYDGTNERNLLVSCEGAHAIVDTVDDLATRDVVRLYHVGTYNCRVISGTSTISQHSYGHALDINGFEMSDGTRFTVLDDWEDGVDNPTTRGGRVLRDAVHAWHDARIWSIILTPEYNAAHDNHFHVDMTPGSHFLGFWDPAFLGEAYIMD